MNEHSSKLKMWPTGGQASECLLWHHSTVFLFPWAALGTHHKRFWLLWIKDNVYKNYLRNLLVLFNLLSAPTKPTSLETTASHYSASYFFSTSSDEISSITDSWITYPINTFSFGTFPASFFFIFIFPIQLTVNVLYKFCQWLDSNCGPMESEATALPTEPRKNQSQCHKLIWVILDHSHKFFYDIGS